MMIINDDSRVINKLETSLTDDARVVIYDHHMFMVQATYRHCICFVTKVAIDRKRSLAKCTTINIYFFMIFFLSTACLAPITSRWPNSCITTKPRSWVAKAGCPSTVATVSPPLARDSHGSLQTDPEIWS
jgi:hypothetical protein